MIQGGINTLEPKGVKATHYTAVYTTEDGKEHPYETDTNRRYSKSWDKFTDSVNEVYK